MIVYIIMYLIGLGHYIKAYNVCLPEMHIGYLFLVEIRRALAW